MLFKSIFSRQMSRRLGNLERDWPTGSPVTHAQSFCSSVACKPIYRRKKKNMLFAGSAGSVRIVKNCDLGLENAPLSLRRGAAFSRPRSPLFTIRTYVFATGFRLRSCTLTLFESMVVVRLLMSQLDRAGWLTFC